MLKWILISINVCLFSAVLFTNGDQMSIAQIAWLAFFGGAIFYAILSYGKESELPEPPTADEGQTK